MAIAGGPPVAVGEALRGVGARVVELGKPQEGTGEGGRGWTGEGGRESTSASARLDALVYDAGPAFAQGGQDRLRDAVERAWTAVRSVATGALIPAGAGKIVLIGPRQPRESVALADAGAFAAAACAGLENLARTLSVEWARYGVTVVAIAPGATTDDQQLAELVCFLVSPAGEYFSGCVFELDAHELLRAS